VRRQFIDDTDYPRDAYGIERPVSIPLAIKAAGVGALVWGGLLIGFNLVGNWWDSFVVPVTSAVGP